MKLLYRIIIRLSICFSIILAAWAILFYISIIKEINEEVDDMLEDYSEYLMTQKLGSDSILETNKGSNNLYVLFPVSKEYAQITSKTKYTDTEAYIPFKDEKEPVRMLSTIFEDKHGQYYELRVYTPSIEKDDLQESIFYWVIFLYLSLLIIIIIINIWVYYRSMRPLHKTLNWLDNYNVGTVNKTLDNETDITEFKKLNKTILDSVSRMEKAFDAQKQFIGNASHEIQTPIAVSLNRIEILMDDDSLTEQQLQELMKTYKSLQYITKLNKSLLLLSKIDNNQFVDRKAIDCNKLILGSLEVYKEAYAHKNIILQVEDNAECTIYMNEMLATILFNNLLKNSYVHNITDGSIIIEMNSDNISFKNTGIKTSLNTDCIFDRFYQGNRNPDSTGLGLAISKSICDIENLSITYSYIDTRHCFTIKTRKDRKNTIPK